jgi:O-antigen ligase
MSGYAAPRTPQGTEQIPARALAGALALTVVSAAGAVVLARNPPPWGLLIVGIVGLAIVLALAIARYETAVALGIALLAVVRFEPAPPDAIFGVVMAVALVTGRFHVDRAPLSILGLLGAFLLINLASAVEAVDPARAALYLSITTYLAVLAVWFTGYLDSVRRARGVVLAYLTGAVITSALSSLSLFIAFPGSTLLSVEGERAKGLFEDPNVYGPFLIPITLIMIEELLAPRLLRMRWLTKATLLLVLVIGLLLSYSRGAWINFALAVMVMLGVMAVRRGGGRRAMTLIVVIALSGIAVGGVLAATGSLGFLQERAKLQSYDSERFAAQRQGVRFGEEYPLGIGPGQFEVRAPVPSHNLYVRVLSEQGFLGLVITLALILATLVFALRNAVLGRDTYGIGSAALLGAWVGILVESVVIDSNHWRHLWLVAALIWVGTRRPSARPGTFALEMPNRASGTR